MTKVEGRGGEGRGTTLLSLLLESSLRLGRVRFG